MNQTEQSSYARGDFDSTGYGEHFAGKDSTRSDVAKSNRDYAGGSRAWSAEERKRMRRSERYARKRIAMANRQTTCAACEGAGGKKKMAWLLGGIGLGALLIFLFDSERGK